MQVKLTAVEGSLATQSEHRRIREFQPMTTRAWRRLCFADAKGRGVVNRCSQFGAPSGGGIFPLVLTFVASPCPAMERDRQANISARKRNRLI